MYCQPNGYVNSGGTRLYYHIIGTGEDTIVIPLDYWNTKAFEKYSDGFTFIFYDTRDRRNSESIEDTSKLGYDFDLIDLENIRKYFDIAKMSLIGTSYYGALIARYAMLYPGHVSKLVMVGALYPRTKPFINYDSPEAEGRVDTTAQRKFFKMKMTGANKTNPIEYCKTYWETYAAYYTGDPSFAKKRNYPCDMPNEWPDNLDVWTTRLFNSLGTWDWREDARKLKMPALVIHGTKDMLVPIESSQEWAKIIPNAKLKVLEGVGHVPWWEFEEIVFPMVSNFLKQ